MRSHVSSNKRLVSVSVPVGTSIPNEATDKSVIILKKFQGDEVQKDVDPDSDSAMDIAPDPSKYLNTNVDYTSTFKHSKKKTKKHRSKKVN